MKFYQIVTSFIFIISCTSSVIEDARITEIKSYKNDKVYNVESSCSSLTNHEKRDYTFSWNNREALNSGYRIIRVGNTYDVLLKIVTKANQPNSQNIIEYKKLSENLSLKWKDCFSKINENMIWDGKKIRFHLVDYNQNIDMPFAVLMNQKGRIGDDDQRYLQEASCELLIKKTFLLLGLGDETPSKQYLCRSDLNANSPLADTEEALYSIKRKNYDYITYRCECDSYTVKNCGEILAKGYQTWGKKGKVQCPENTYLIKKYILKRDLWEWGQENQTQIRSYYKRPFGNLGFDLLCQAYGSLASKYSHCQKLESSYFLKPAHFRAILNPLCQGLNSKYYECSKALYITSKKECSAFQEDHPDCSKSDWLD